MEEILGSVLPLLQNPEALRLVLSLFPELEGGTVLDAIATDLFERFELTGLKDDLDNRIALEGLALEITTAFPCNSIVR